MTETVPAVSIGPWRRPPDRRPDVSFRCHVGGHANHKGCDGRSYGPTITSPHVPCTCDCHNRPAPCYA